MAVSRRDLMDQPPSFEQLDGQRRRRTLAVASCSATTSPTQLRPTFLIRLGLDMWPDLSLVRMMALSVHSFVLTLKVE
jgi:hypothetical protein